MVLGVAMAMLAFLHLPLGRRTALGWARLLLDGATVAVAGALIFWYVRARPRAGRHLDRSPESGRVGRASAACSPSW